MKISNPTLKLKIKKFKMYKNQGKHHCIAEKMMIMKYSRKFGKLRKEFVVKFFAFKRKYFPNSSEFAFSNNTFQWFI
jgi:hypothetical protein